VRFDTVTVWRPYVRAGVTWQNTDHFLLDAGFLEAPAGISPFVVSTKVDEVLADVGAGVDVIHAAGVVIRVQYDGRFGENTQQNSVGLKGSVAF
jgi:outer membrane autotransporter protein